jgi:hypothetical protein
MQSLIAHVIESGYKAELVNHFGTGDSVICHQLNGLFDSELEMIEEAAPLKVKGILGNV